MTGFFSRQRQILNSIIFICFICLTAFTSVSLADEITQTYTFEHPSFERVSIDGRSYDRVTIPGAKNDGAPGMPSLPVIGAKLLLPMGSRVVSVETTFERKESLGTGFDIAPAQFPYILSKGPSSATAALPDKRVYEKDEVYPSDQNEYVGTVTFRGYDYALVRITPIEFNPMSGEVWFYSEISITVKTEDAGKSASMYRGFSLDAAEITKKVDNSETLDSYAGALKNSADLYDYMIITSPALAASFIPLQSYHNSRGMITQIHTTDDIGSNDPGDVRDYIRDAYLNDGIEYVLIGGDDDIIPARDLFAEVRTGDGMEQDATIPGDLYFGCLDGTYDYNGNGIYGEYGDGGPGNQAVDMVAEVYVGRASVGNIEEAQRFVSKTLRYRSTQATYLKNSFLVGEYLGFGGVSEYGGNMVDQLVDFCEDDDYFTTGMPSTLFEFDRLYDRDYAGSNWPNSELFRRINENVHIINHDGHANSSWALKSTSTTAFEELKNNHLFLLYSQGCMPGAFDWGECWAEHVAIKTDHGAFAILMNARFGWGSGYSTDGSSQRYQREFWDAIYNPAENYPELGRANADSKEDNLHMASGGSMKWVYYEMNLFGDPTITLWDKWLGLESYEFSDVQGNNNGIFEAGEIIELRCAIENIGIDLAENISMSIEISDVSIPVTVSQSSLGNIGSGGIESNDATPFIFTIPADYVTRVDTFYISITWEEEGEAKEASLTFYSPVGAVPILLVDGNASDNKEYYYLDFMNKNSLPYTYWESELSGGPMASDLNNYDIVIWFTGDFQTTPLSQENVDAMRGYLDNGGNLFLTGQGIAASVNIFDQEFLHSYLRVEYGFSQMWPILITDPMSQVFHPLDTIGIQGSGSAGNQTFPDRVDTLNGSTPEFQWYGTDKFGGVSYSGAYKLVYFTFGFEAITAGDDRWIERDTIMTHVLEFLNMEYAAECPEITGMSIDPSELTHLMDHSPDISWLYSDPSGSDQVMYQIQTGDDYFWSPDNMWDSGPISGTTSNMTYSGLPLEDGHDYCIRVRGNNGAMWSDWSYTMVHLNSIPLPSNLSPTNGEISYLGHIKLWHDEEQDIENDVVTYSYELYADEAMTILIEQIDGIPGGSEGKLGWAVASELVVGEDYFWRVRAYDGLEFGQWTSLAQFIVGPEYICGDANGDDMVNVGDAVSIINFVFKDGTAPDPIQAGDANCDATCNIGDGVALISFIFNGGVEPCANCPD